MMKRPLLATLLCACTFSLGLAVADQENDWVIVDVPGSWEEAGGGLYAKYEGVAWYRCLVKVPAEWKGEDLSLTVQAIANSYEAFVNGVRIGGGGAFPPKYRSGFNEQPTSYTIEARNVKAGEWNLVAIRVYRKEGRGGFLGGAPALGNDVQAIALKGKWQFRTGDNPPSPPLGKGGKEETPLAKGKKETPLAKGKEEAPLAKGKKETPPLTKGKGETPPLGKGGKGGVPAEATFTKVEDAATVTRRLFLATASRAALSPAESLKRFKISDDLVLEEVLAEPRVGQPLGLSFDERGRMWVAQYLQYPNPAGLKMLSRDRYWRAVYDKVPQPPPNHFKGKDKISIHEDTDGDGVFDKHSAFVEGLSITTSAARGRGGVWVLNPPYLLFYPDRNNDDVPDGPPEVHLEGFGMQDTHSVTNSLRWGPDGWLYATQGSTVGANVKRPGLDKTPVLSMGQLVWRYHPESRRYEIFAEGGGNAFGLEIDSKGRIYSGHNGGNTRGFHYVQGGYYQKGFSKHGPLSNPYSFGYFPHMQHVNVPRFTHTFLIYEGGAFPKRWQGKLFAVAPLQSHVVACDVLPHGTSFQTKDIEHPVTTTDSWFRPVNIMHGPDGALYVADFYEAHIAHLRHFEGLIDNSTGRVYRLKARAAQPARPLDMSKLITPELIELLGDANRWKRETALRLIGDRRDQNVIPMLSRMVLANSGQLALEALWALNLSGGLDEAMALKTLDHQDPFVRLWTIRLLGDSKDVSPTMASRLARLAKTESHGEVRSQLSSTARRLPAAKGLPIVRQLLGHDEDTDDIHIPLLLWWGIEAKAESDRDLVLELFTESDVWRLRLVEKHILERLMRRYAQAGQRKDLLTCARLLQLAPSAEHAKKLLAGLEQGFAGRSLANLPEELLKAMAVRGGGSLALRLRLGDTQAVEEALKTLGNAKADGKQRLSLVQIFAEVPRPACVPVLLELAGKNGDAALRQAALNALQPYHDAQIAQQVIKLHNNLPAEVRPVAQLLLGSRKTWTRLLLEAVDTGVIEPKAIPVDLVRKLTFHRDDTIAKLIGKHWGKVQGATTAEMQKKIAHYQEVLARGKGSPYPGKKLFMETCGKCHMLFDRGGKIGPDLTTYKRDDTANLLLHIVNPSAEIREGFETNLVATDDGRALTGFLVDQDNRIVVVRNAEGQDITIPRERIEDLRAIGQSLMPEGLLDNWNDQQVRDLFAYLRTMQPLND